MNEPPFTTDTDSGAFARARELFEAAVGWPEGERAARLRAACGGDETLAAVVERMLRADGSPHRLLDYGLSLSAERLRPGDVVGRNLQVIALIGAGGMGEVYRAHDSSLGRDVAIKVLGYRALDGIELDHERLARLRREAQLLAALNHPNIAVIHAIEEWSASASDPLLVALVLELVDGPTLADRLVSGHMAIGEAVPVARQIAEALEAAHAQGIVHRDLKPHNVKLRPDGVVKLLDFGLAKIAAALPSAEDAAVSPTITNATDVQRGVRLGTPAYMSPEQARGEEADSRSDIWAFGAVLYEMLSGVRAFPGQDAASALGAVLHRPVDWSALDRSIPSSIRSLLGRCLERDPRRRLRDIGEARIALEDLAAAISSGSQPASAAAPSPRRGLAMALGGAAVAAAVAFVLFWPRPAPELAPVSRFTLSMPPRIALEVDPQSRDLAITPDGSHIVYKGGSRSDRTQLFVRGIDQLDPVPLTPPGRPKGPFASHDGRWIGFFVPGARGPGLKKVAITGGPVVDVAQLDGASRGAVWAEDGSVILATAALDTGLQRVPAAGGSPEILTRPARDKGEGDHLFPHLLPGGNAVLFTVTTLTGGASGAQVALLDLRSRTWKTLIRGGSQPHYLASGHLVYMAGGALWAIPFDPSSMETHGTARVVVPQVLTLPNGTAEFDVAQNGTLVYVTGTHLPPQRTLVWVDRAGREQPIDAAAVRPYSSARLSPDGTRIALEIDDEENDIWVWHIARQVMTRVTDDPGLDEGAIWTPDGRDLIFTSQFNGALGSLFRKPADGSGTIERLTNGTSVQRAWAVLPDSSGVLFDEFSSLMLLPFADRHERSVLRTPQIVRSGAVSPDGHWIAYVGGEGGMAQILMRPYPNVEDAKMQASIEGGSQPVWARNGRELFFLAPGGVLMRVEVGAHGIDGSAPPRQVLQQPYFEGSGLTSPRTFDVSPDGTRFLMIKTPSLESDPAAAVRVVVVLNWGTELGQLVPPR